MNHTYRLLLTCLIILPAGAQEALERSDLGLVERQFAAIEQVAEHARNSQADADAVRYRFDYLKFAADLNRVRQGIHRYLSPSRAQPADLVELAGQYRAEAPHSSYSDEHD